MEDLTLKFNTLFHKISSPGFLRMEALGGEIPFFIATYDANRKRMYVNP